MNEVREEKYRLWLAPNGIIHVEERSNCVVHDKAILQIYEAQAELDVTQLDLPGGFMLYDADVNSTDMVNMAASGLAKEQGIAIRGLVVFAVQDADGNLSTLLDRKTADWLGIFAGGRCTVCGKPDLALKYDAFPISNGRCCERCAKVAESVRNYMGLRYTPSVMKGAKK